jgi:RHS repeat-associated protein
MEKRTWVWNANSGTWQVTEDLKFMSGPMLFGRHIMELNATNIPLARSYVWGLGLSETMDGAGGVGGFLWVRLHTASGAAAGTHFVAYDGNGNVVALVSATTGTETARYEYGPFGEPIRVTGPAAGLNPFRFSTKRTDPTTDLVLYEYRVYSPTLGRWLSRDPIGELGGWASYAIGANSLLNTVDLYGLKDYKLGTEDPTIRPDVGAGAWGSKPPHLVFILLKLKIQEAIPLAWLGMPDAANHLLHYFGNSGRDYTIRLQKMIDDVPSAKRVYERELALAQQFVESLPEGKHQITSGAASGAADGAYITESESPNWYFAVAGYNAWGKGIATVCKDEYTLQFEYKFYDRYNWDIGKEVKILGVTVTDKFMGEFHRQAPGQRI